MAKKELMLCCKMQSCSHSFSKIFVSIQAWNQNLYLKTQKSQSSQNILWIALEMSLNYDLWIGLRLCKKLEFFPVLWEDWTTFSLDFSQVNLVLPPSELLRYRTLFLKSKSCIICYLKISWFEQVTGVPFPFESWKPLHWEEEAQRNNFLPNSY